VRSGLPGAAGESSIFNDIVSRPRLLCKEKAGYPAGGARRAGTLRPPRWEGEEVVVQLTFKEVNKRRARLAQLERGLAKELGLVGADDGLLLFRERRRYLRAVREALAGAEGGRVVLQGVVRRMERG
jgi:hypothetical protein